MYDCCIYNWILYGWIIYYWLRYCWDGDIYFESNNDIIVIKWYRFFVYWYVLSDWVRLWCYNYGYFIRCDYYFCIIYYECFVWFYRCYMVIINCWVILCFGSNVNCLFIMWLFDSWYIWINRRLNILYIFGWVYFGWKCIFWIKNKYMIWLWKK